MSAEKMKPGDVVLLRSGGPRMTVLHKANGGWTCGWFEGAAFFQQSLPEDALRSAQETRSKTLEPVTMATDSE